jgi:hypothetical protein
MTVNLCSTAVNGPSPGVVWRQAGTLQGAAVLSRVEEVPLKAPVGAAVSTRPRVVVLGSGWAAMSMIKALPDNIK